MNRQGASGLITPPVGAKELQPKDVHWPYPGAGQTPPGWEEGAAFSPPPGSTLVAGAAPGVMDAPNIIKGGSRLAHAVDFDKKQIDIHKIADVCWGEAGSQMEEHAKFSGRYRHPFVTGAVFRCAREKLENDEFLQDLVRKGFKVLY